MAADRVVVAVSAADDDAAFAVAGDEGDVSVQDDVAVQRDILGEDVAVQVVDARQGDVGSVVCGADVVDDDPVASDRHVNRFTLFFPYLINIDGFDAAEVHIAVSGDIAAEPQAVRVGCQGFERDRVGEADGGGRDVESACACDGGVEEGGSGSDDFGFFIDGDGFSRE